MERVLILHFRLKVRDSLTSFLSFACASFLLTDSSLMLIWLSFWGVCILWQCRCVLPKFRRNFLHPSSGSTVDDRCSLPCCRIAFSHHPFLLDRIWWPSRPSKQSVSIWVLKQPERHAATKFYVMLNLGMLWDMILLSHAKFVSAYLSIMICLHNLVLNKTLLYV